MLQCANTAIDGRFETTETLDCSWLCCAVLMHRTRCLQHLVGPLRMDFSGGGGRDCRRPPTRPEPGAEFPRSPQGHVWELEVGSSRRRFHWAVSFTPARSARSVSPATWQNGWCCHFFSAWLGLTGPRELAPSLSEQPFFLR